MAESTNPLPAVPAALEVDDDGGDSAYGEETLVIGGKLHTAPIGDNPQRILDVGCGTGIWAIDIGILSN
ncbi:unnamed protein product [Sphagnum balticum]